MIEPTLAAPAHFLVVVHAILLSRFEALDVTSPGECNLNSLIPSFLVCETYMLRVTTEV